MNFLSCHNIVDRMTGNHQASVLVLDVFENDYQIEQMSILFKLVAKTKDGWLNSFNADNTKA